METGIVSAVPKGSGYIGSWVNAHNVVLALERCMVSSSTFLIRAVTHNAPSSSFPNLSRDTCASAPLLVSQIQASYPTYIQTTLSNYTRSTQPKPNRTVESHLTSHHSHPLHNNVSLCPDLVHKTQTSFEPNAADNQALGRSAKLQRKLPRPGGWRVYQ